MDGIPQSLGITDEDWAQTPPSILAVGLPVHVWIKETEGGAHVMGS
jgi:hypothetical protein